MWIALGVILLSIAAIVYGIYYLYIYATAKMLATIIILFLSIFGLASAKDL